MQKIMPKQNEVFVIAVSGGVDSIVLLDLLVKNKLGGSSLGLTGEVASSTYKSLSMVVAHFNHGIREESAEDAVLVKQLANMYNLPFELGTARLGSGTSEATARQERYNFLRQVCKKHNSSTLVLAHHQDDLLETALINIIRGTGWRGLASLRSQSLHNGKQIRLLRPLLFTPKNKIEEYAHQHSLSWHEDSTNNDQAYLRNYIRHSLIPQALKKDPNFKLKLLRLIKSTQHLRSEIDNQITELLESVSIDTASSNGTIELSRYNLTMWPAVVAQEVIYRVLTNLEPTWHPNKFQINKTLNFAKTGLLKKKINISKHLEATAQNRSIQFKKQ